MSALATEWTKVMCHLLSARLAETLMPKRYQRNVSMSASYQTLVVRS